MKITRLTNQKINNDRVNVFIDGKYELSLTKDQLLSQKLFINKEIEEGELQVLKKISNEGLIRSRVIEWLFIRPRSARELSIYLKKKNLDIDFASQLTLDMQNKKYQDDKAFCNWWIEQRLSKKMSLIKIKAELFAKGVSKEIIDETIKDKNIDDYQNMLDFIDKKRLTVKYKDEIKLKQYLLSKGYSYDTIKSYFSQQS
jgi:regulatory protein